MYAYPSCSSICSLTTQPFVAFTTMTTAFDQTQLYSELLQLNLTSSPEDYVRVGRLVNELPSTDIWLKNSSGEIKRLRLLWYPQPLVADGVAEEAAVEIPDEEQVPYVSSLRLLSSGGTQGLDSFIFVNLGLITKTNFLLTWMPDDRTFAIVFDPNSQKGLTDEAENSPIWTTEPGQRFDDFLSFSDCTFARIDGDPFCSMGARPEILGTQGYQLRDVRKREGCSIVAE